MYLPSYLEMDCSEITPDSTADPLMMDEVDETAMQIAEAHAGLRFLAKYTDSPEARARLVAAMRALEAIDRDVGHMQEAARKREAED